MGRPTNTFRGFEASMWHFWSLFICTGQSQYRFTRLPSCGNLSLLLSPGFSRFSRFSQFSRFSRFSCPFFLYPVFFSGEFFLVRRLIGKLRLVNPSLRQRRSSSRVFDDLSSILNSRQAYEGFILTWMKNYWFVFRCRFLHDWTDLHLYSATNIFQALSSQLWTIFFLIGFKFIVWTRWIARRDVSTVGEVRRAAWKNAWMNLAGKSRFDDKL